MIDHRDAYLEAAVDVLGPFLTAEERKVDRENLIELANQFRYFCDEAARAPTFGDVGKELDGIWRAATHLLGHLNRISPEAARFVGNEFVRRRMIEGEGYQAFDFDDLRRMLAELAVFADEARHDPAWPRGGQGNVAERPWGSGLRRLAYNVTDFVDAYATGACGVRKRPNLEVSGTPSGAVFAVTKNIAGYVLGETAEVGLEKAVERAVSQFRQYREKRYLLQLGRTDDFDAFVAHAGLNYARHLDLEIERLLNARRPA